MHALFDLDGSLVDYYGALRESLERLRSPEEAPYPEDICWGPERHNHIRERIRVIKSIPGWWRSLEPIPEGMAVLNAAKEIGYTINVLTRGPKKHPNGWSEKLEWCRRYLPNTDVHITDNKSLTEGVFLYDDYPVYMEAWLSHRPYGLGILPDAPYNQGYSHPNVIRYTRDNYADVVEALKTAYTLHQGL